MGKPSKGTPAAPVVESLQRVGWRAAEPLEGRPAAREVRPNESGQSSVWRAEHPHKQRGVLKVARGHSQVERIRREIEIMRRVSHPAIIPIIDADPACEPPWLITAEGVPLVEVWDRAPSNDDERFEQAQRMVLHLAGGLAVAHENGVVHRDVKPENVVLLQANEPGSAALIDFGIAYDAHGARLTEVGGRAVANQFAAPPEAYYGPLDDPPRWWDCLGLAWLWGWLISAEDREPKGNRYHWKYQPLVQHPRSQAVRALIAVCSSEGTAPTGIPEFVELATRLGIGRLATGARRANTAFTEAANKHVAALAQKRLVEQERREEVDGCAQALAVIYEDVIRDLNQVVEDVRTLGVDVQGRTWPDTTIAELLASLGVGDNAILWQCSGSMASGPLDLRLVAHYNPIHEAVWPIEFYLFCTSREIPNARVFHRRDGTPVDPTRLSPVDGDALQHALEWILRASLMGAPG